MIVGSIIDTDGYTCPTARVSPDQTVSLLSIKRPEAKFVGLAIVVAKSTRDRVYVVGKKGLSWLVHLEYKAIT